MSSWTLYSFKSSASESMNTKRLVSPLDVACALVLFKRRHRLSISCINHLVKLLASIPRNCISESWSILKILLQQKAILSPSVVSYICTSCSKILSTNLIWSECRFPFDSSSSTIGFRNFNTIDQLSSIISTNYHFMNLNKRFTSDVMKDICDGELHRKVQEICQDPFITLTLNIDGIQPNKGSKKTIWPILLVVNEIPLQYRFSPENLILAGVWSGSTKPSRTSMAHFLRPVVNELTRLENGAAFYIPSDASLSNHESIRIRVYLIGACCDKPAQASVQNIPEPIAAFCCGRCEIEVKYLL